MRWQSTKKDILVQAVVFVVIFLIAFVSNKIPSGTVVAGGDFYQFFGPLHNCDRYLYAWINQIGQGSGVS